MLNCIHVFSTALNKMNNSKLILIFLIYFCTANTSIAISSPCASTVSALPPDPTSGCCGVDSTGNKVTEGLETAIDQYPWVALIELEKDGILKTPCGGALISSKYVLSVAHCVSGAALKVGKPKNIRLGEYDTRVDGPDCVQVIAGGTDCTDGITRIPIEKIIPHPDYESVHRRIRNDISLIRMERAAPYTDFIRPLCLPSTDVTLNKKPFYLTKAGWGQVSGLSPVKTQVQLPFVSQEKCQRTYSTVSRNVTLWKGHICAGGELGKDSCLGDAGVPLVLENGNRYEAIAISSFGVNPCGQMDVPSVYTNVYEYKSWIIDNIVA